MRSLPEWDDPDRRDAALRRVAARIAQPDPLTRSELAVVFLESHGVPRGKIAEWLNLSHHTVTDCMKHARRKLYAETRAHAVATALRLGLFS